MPTQKKLVEVQFYVDTRRVLADLGRCGLAECLPRREGLQGLLAMSLSEMSTKSNAVMGWQRVSENRSTS